MDLPGGEGGGGEGDSCDSFPDESHPEKKVISFGLGPDCQ